MTNEEFERLKESFRAQMEGSPPPRVLLEETAARRKLNRDMDRLERVLQKVVSAPRPEKSQSDQRRVETEKAYEQRRAEIREIGARSNAKLKALMEKLQIAGN
ncbi:MAG: hypothetical protein ACT4OT_06335 [Acidobacteriota bacterium]